MLNGIKKYIGRIYHWQKIKRPERPGILYWLKVAGRQAGVVMLAMLLYFFMVEANFLWLFGRSPGLEDLEAPKVNQASELFTEDGVPIGRYYTENRSSVSYDKLSPTLVNALVATEDERFYEHSGVDFEAMPGVILGNLRGQSRGGSTITQQLAKNLYRTRGTSGLLGRLPLLGTIISKTKEWITAAKLERRFTKEEIISLYFNTVEFGHNAFGIKTAAKTFFHTSTDSVTVNEAAMLVGLLKAPTSYSPILHPKRALGRRNVVLGQMLKYGKLRQADHDRLKELPIGLHIYTENPSEGSAPYFRAMVAAYLQEWCKKNGYDLYRDGLRVYTTLNSSIQAHAEEAVSGHMENLQRKFFQHWKDQAPWVDDKDNEIPGFIESAIKRTSYYKWLKKKYEQDTATINRLLNTPKPMTVFSWKGDRDTVLSSLDSLRYYKHFLHAGFMAMEPRTGYIRAWVGGIEHNYFQYDHVKQARRQPGSTFKPILYTAAFEEGYGPCDSIYDQPVTIRYEEKGEHKVWSPHNADYVFSGRQMTLRHAMARSINSVAAQLTEKIGWEKVISQAKKMGITSPLDTVPSIGLGSSDVTVYEMTGAYSAFMNGGVWTEPAFITHITDKNGKLIKRFQPERRTAMTEETAWLMQYMLRGGMEEQGGTSQALFEFDLFRGNEIGGKTGTSSNHSDGWFMGVTKDLVAGMWVGGEDRSIHFRTSAMGEGSKTALPIFGRFMEKVYNDPATGITMGAFPRPKNTLSKRYDCRMPYIRTDTTATDAADTLLQQGGLPPPE